MSSIVKGPGTMAEKNVVRVAGKYRRILIYTAIMVSVTVMEAVTNPGA